MDIIYSGYLIKEGGKGHQYKNEKRRWFVLKDLYLFYYSSPPSPTKNTLNLKGIIYLDKCVTKDNESRPGTFILESPFKEYILISISDNPASDILAWRNALDYAIEQTKLFNDTTSLSGWLQKKGGLGHTYQNWKSRYFVLQGNLLLYFSEETKVVSMKNLKGFIEISQITDIDTDVTSDGNGFHFVISVNNDKSYILSTKDLEIKKQWVTTLRQKIRTSGKLNLQTSLTTLNNEKIIKSGKLLRHLDLKKRKSNFFVLTNVNLRVYSSPVDLSLLPQSWAKGMIECIPLLGCTVQIMNGKEESEYISDKVMGVIDIQANAYLLEAESPDELKGWVKAIKETSRDLAKQIIRAGETIRLTCNAFDKNNINAGYTIMTLDKNKITLKYLMLKKEVVIPFSQLKLVYLQQTYLFCLKYVQSDKAKQLKMKCRNAIGIFDTVEAIFEESGSGKQFKKNGNALRHESYVSNDKNDPILQSDKKMTREMLLNNRKTLSEQEINEMKLRAEKEKKKPRKKKTSAKKSQAPNKSNDNNEIKEDNDSNTTNKRKKKKKNPNSESTTAKKTKVKQQGNKPSHVEKNPTTSEPNHSIPPPIVEEKNEEKIEEKKETNNQTENEAEVSHESNDTVEEVNPLFYNDKDIKKIIEESSPSIVIKEESTSYNPLHLPVLKPLKESSEKL